MENETFKTRVMKLMQKSRKALRLYTGVSRSSDDSGELSEVQISEWRTVNAELLRVLSSALQQPNQRLMYSEVLSARDRFSSEWRTRESDLRLMQEDLVVAAGRGDFITAANLSIRLVGLKARCQANQAVQHELQGLLDRSGLQPSVGNSQAASHRISASSKKIDSINVGNGRVHESSESPDKVGQGERRSSHLARELDDEVGVETQRVAKVIPLRNIKR